MLAISNYCCPSSIEQSQKCCSLRNLALICDIAFFILAIGTITVFSLALANFHLGPLNSLGMGAYAVLVTGSLIFILESVNLIYHACKRKKSIESSSDLEQNRESTVILALPRESLKGHRWAKEFQLKKPLCITLSIGSLRPQEDDKKIAAELFERMKTKMLEEKIQNVRFEKKEGQFFIHFSCHENEITAIMNCCGFSKYLKTSIAVGRDDLTLQENQEDFGCFLSRHNFEEKKEHFEKVSSDFLALKESCLVNVAKDLVSQFRNPFSYIKFLIKKYRAVCVGESHRDSTPKKILMQNFESLYDLGVRTLYLEHLFYDSMQPMLDHYFKMKEMYPQLKAYLKQLDNGQAVDPNFGYLKLVEKAIEAGIRVVAIDTTVSYSIGTSDKMGVVDNELRMKAMNSVSAAIIEIDQINHPGDYVILTGSAHPATLEEYPEVAGLAEILGVPIATCFDNRSSRSLKKGFKVEINQTPEGFLNPVAVNLTIDPDCDLAKS